MADIQIDNGDFTRIANAILENIAKAKLNGTQRSIIDILWRYTYGFQRGSAKMSLSFISNATDLDKHQIQRELIKLIDRKIILVEKESTYTTPQILKFNKDFEQWSIQLAKTLTVSETAKSTVSELAHSTVSGLANQERKVKESIKENSIVPFEEIKDSFNSICTLLPKVVSLSKSRKDKIRTRYQELQSVDKFIYLFTKVQNAPFLCGQNNNGWRATFDWLIENDKNYLKVLEGQYDKQTKNSDIMRGVKM